MVAVLDSVKVRTITLIKKEHVGQLFTTEELRRAGLLNYRDGCEFSGTGGHVTCEKCLDGVHWRVKEVKVFY
ncbi:MAG: hypothetical protein WCO23_03265 [bacterium]